jgi:phosphoglycerol transferase
VPRQTGGRNGTNWRAEALTFLLSGLLCCAALTWALQLWRADLRVPIQYGYGGDLTFECMLAKDIVDTGWFLHNPRLGAPGEQDLRDFPMPDLVTALSMKIMGWFTSSWGAVVNLYFFAGFLLATWSALAVLRHFKLARAPAVVAALLFAFAPYHFFRGEQHLFLSAYFVIPLAGMLMLWVMSDERLFILTRCGRFFWLPVPSGKGAVALAACALLGSDGAYYAFFTILLLMGTGVYRAFEVRSFRRAVGAVMLVGLIGLTVVLNLLPSIVHVLVDGKNPKVAVRTPIEAETYALKLTQLVLPIAGHRVAGLAAFKAAYQRAHGLSESDAAALGAFGAAGFCFLMLSLVAGCPSGRHRELIRHLSLLNLCAFLIGTLGGIGSLVAWTLSPQIRGYNRISIFICFFSCAAVAAVLDEVLQRWVRPGLSVWLFRGALTAILVAGILDQTKPADVPDYQSASEQYRSDAEFASHAERWLPHNSMVLQLPFVPFPEALPPGSMKPYDPLLPFLHSTTLRWSYGAITGRYWDAWQAGIASGLIEDTLDAATAAGFRAIYIDRNGYADRGAAIGSELSALGLARIEARNGRFWLYNIQPYAIRMQAEFAPENWARMRDAVLHPLVLRWLPQCSGLEGDAQRNWHWCGNEGSFLLENTSAQVKKVDIHGTVVPAAAGVCNLRVDGPGWAQTVPLNSAYPQPLAHRLEISPGTSIVRLTSDCQRLLAPRDTRPLVFRIDNFRAALADAAPVPELVWSGGFYPIEHGESKTWHWCSSSGELIVRNPGPPSETVIRMIVASSQAMPSQLSITGPGFADSVTIDQAGTAFSKRFLVPQGSSVIRFSSPAAPLITPNDPRKLVFRIEDLRLGEPLLTPHLIQAN